MRRTLARRFLLGLLATLPPTFAAGAASAYSHGPTAVPDVTGCTIVGSGTNRTFHITWNLDAGKPIGGGLTRDALPVLSFNIPRKANGAADIPVNNQNDAYFAATWYVVLDGRKASDVYPCTPG